MSEFRIACIGAAFGFCLMSALSMLLGPPRDGLHALLLFAGMFATAAVAMFGKRAQ